ncbi:hypothetical protein HYQ46_007870 [Verticillium longisporum]|nr:hypothetical protein HYQ46_007870 [Verticillium longisporum]
MTAVDEQAKWAHGHPTWGQDWMAELAANRHSDSRTRSQTFSKNQSSPGRVVPPILRFDSRNWPQLAAPNHPTRASIRKPSIMVALACFRPR